MLIDLRTYTFHPGKLPEFLPLFEAEGLPLQRGYCGNLLFYAVGSTGSLNEVVQAWAYKDTTDRDARRSALWHDRGFIAFGKKALPLIRHQENQLLATTSFTTIAHPFAGCGLIDLRAYTFIPGGLREFLPICAEQGLPKQRAACGHMVFHATSESGTLNQLVQAWAYRDEADYNARQKTLFADGAWTAAYRSKVIHLAVHQQHRFLTPTAFSPDATNPIV